MASIRIIKRRIKSAKNISQVTKALQMVSAVKMRRAQEAANAGKPYAEELIKVLEEISGKVEKRVHPFLTAPSKIEKVWVVAVGPEKGLAGALVTNLAKKVFLVTDRIRNGKLLLSDDGLGPVVQIGTDTKLTAVSWGKKSREILKKTGIHITADFSLKAKEPVDAQIHALAHLLSKAYLDHEADLVVIIYSNFVNTVTQKPRAVQYLPMVTVLGNNQGGVRKIVNFEPSEEDVIGPLLEHYLLTVLNQIILDATASEHSARMVAMKNAYDNATDIIKSLTLNYNQTRQSAITNEIADIVSGSIVSD